MSIQVCMYVRMCVYVCCVCARNCERGCACGNACVCVCACSYVYADVTSRLAKTSVRSYFFTYPWRVQVNWITIHL